MTKKSDKRFLKDAQKLQKIMEVFEKQAAIEAQQERKVLFESKNELSVIPQAALEARASIDQALAQQSPNPLADMADTLGKCFQCGVPFSLEERERQSVYQKLGQIFLCLHCMKDIQDCLNGNNNIQLGLPFAASQLCADQYAAYLEQEKLRTN